MRNKKKKIHGHRYTLDLYIFTTFLKGYQLYVYQTVTTGITKVLQTEKFFFKNQSEKKKKFILILYLKNMFETWKRSLIQTKKI